MASPTKAKPAGQPSVTAHPLFPAIVALWFAALLGIGSLVLPQALYDKLGQALGLGGLGFSARLGIAVFAGAAGGALGMFLARKAAASQTGEKPARPARTQPAGKTVRPISAMEELGSDRLDEPVTARQPDPFTGRRRALSVTDESGPSEYLAHVPLPGGDSTLDLIGVDHYGEHDALELGSFEDAGFDADTGIAADAESGLGGDPFPAAPAAPKQRQIFQPDPAPALAVPTAPEPKFDAPIRAFESADTDWSSAGPVAASDAAPAFAAPYSSSAGTTPRPFTPPPPMAGLANPSPAPFGAPVTMPTAAQMPTPAPIPPESTAPFAMPNPAPNPAPYPAEAAPDALAAAVRPALAPFAMPQAAAPAPLNQSPPVQPELPVKADALSKTSLSGLALADLIDRFADALRSADPATLTQAMPDGLRQFAPPAEAASAALAMPAAEATIAPPFAPQPAEPVASEPVAQVAPLAAPFDAPSERPFEAPAALPAALQPIGFGDGEAEDGDGEEAFGHPFTLPIAAEPKPFSAPPAPEPAAPPQPEAAVPAVPAPFTLPQHSECAGVDSDDESEQDDAFGSLLAMKSGFGPGREFVRIEDDAEPSDGIEPVVVFPGTASQGRAAPAADGPSRDPAPSDPASPAPFAPPPFGRAPFGLPPLAGADQPAPFDRQATEQALRDALAKLQQMSGAA